MLTVSKVILNSTMCLYLSDSTLEWRLQPPTDGQPEWKTGEGWLLIGPTTSLTATQRHTHTHTNMPTHTLTLAKGFDNHGGNSSYTWLNTDFQLAGYLSGAAAAPPPGQIRLLAQNKRAMQKLFYHHLNFPCCCGHTHSKETVTIRPRKQEKLTLRLISLKWDIFFSLITLP